MKDCQKPSFKNKLLDIFNIIVNPILCILGMVFSIDKYSKLKIIIIVFGIYTLFFIISLMINTLIYAYKLHKYCEKIEINRNSLEETYNKNVEKLNFKQKQIKDMNLMLDTIINLVETSLIVTTEEEKKFTKKLLSIIYEKKSYLMSTNNKTERER